MATIAGVGIDIVDMRRLRGARYFDRLAQYILLKKEMELMRRSRDPVQFVASRFAVKEALIKACPVPLSYHDILIEKRGVRLGAHFRPSKAPGYQIQVSLAHEVDYAVACATICL